MSGYIKLHRGWHDSDLFKDNEPYCERAAWAWLLSNAAWKNIQRVGPQGDLIQVKEGEFHTSYRSLAKAWNWDKNKVSRFIKRATTCGNIGTSAGQAGLHLTICNWREYQGGRDKREPESGTSAGQARDTQEEGIRKDKKKELIDYVEIQDRWNAIDGVVKCRSISKQRKSAINARIAEHGHEAIWSVFSAIKQSKFHCGGGQDGWQADIDHAFQASSFLKHLEKGAPSIGSEKKAFANADEWDTFCESSAKRWDGIKPDMAEEWRAKKKVTSNVVSIDASAEIGNAVRGLVN